MFPLVPITCLRWKQPTIKIAYRSAFLFFAFFFFFFGAFGFT